MAPRWGQDGEKIKEKRERNKKEGGLSFPPPCWAEKAANMAPSWHPKAIKNREKIDAKIDQKFDASWDRFLEGFWLIFRGKMEACWHQSRAKIDANFEERFFEKALEKQ